MHWLLIGVCIFEAVIFQAMNLFTEFKSNLCILPKIIHDQEIFLLGSCFSENMTTFFKKFGFKVVTNPFGVVYNPESISKLINKSFNKEPLLPNEIVEKSDGFASWLMHSQHTYQASKQLIEAFNKCSNIIRNYNSERVFVITLGTAWVYKLIESQMVCANCHKINAEKFSKHLLSLEEITHALRCLQSPIINQGNKIIYTLSPVRHIKDGFIENAKSKARLHEVLTQMVDKKQVFYFPSYEIMLDQLRDYRFYAQDMLHPNQTALGVIWSYFCKWCFSDKTQNLGEMCTKYYKLKGHKLMSTDAMSIQNNKNKIIETKKKLKSLNAQLELNYKIDAV